MKAILLLIAIALSLLAPAMFAGLHMSSDSMDPNYLLSSD
jgi:hypothetical protein